MKHTTTNLRKTPFGRPAFTLMEVLIAMGIFAVGFVAVAAIFPTAVLLQKKTVDDVVAQQVARNAEALLEGKGLLLDSNPPPATPPAPGYLLDQMTQASFTSWDTDQRVYPLPPSMLSDAATPSTSPKQKWLLPDRSYPSSTNPPGQRKVFWVPFVRDPIDTPGVVARDVVVYVFILQRSSDATYPRPIPYDANWANYYDFEEQRNPAPPYSPVNPGPDVNDSWLVPGVVKQTVTVSASDLSRFDFGTNGNNWTSGSNTYFKANPGDQILDCYGGVHTVNTADSNGVTVNGFINPNLNTGVYPDVIWYAHPDVRGRQRPGRRILTLTGVVK